MSRIVAKLFSFFSIAGVAIISAFCLWLNPIIKKQSTDSAVFIYVGRVMVNGGLPYIDVFDHKGPLLYLIEYLGLNLAGTSGVWFIEVVIWFQTILFLFHFISMRRGVLLGVASITLYSYLCCRLIDGGNIVESYATHLLTLSALLMLAYLKDAGRIGILCVQGFLLGLVFMLRVNMVGIGFVTLFIIVYNGYKEKNISKVVRHILTFALGGFLAIGFISLWLISVGAFGEMLKQYIVFNLSYLSSMVNLVAEYTWVFCAIAVLGLALCLFKRFRNLEYCACWLMYMIPFLIIVINPRYNHYFAILIGSVVLMLIVVVANLSKRFQRYFAILAILYCGVALTRATLFLNLDTAEIKRDIKTRSFSIRKDYVRKDEVSYDFKRISQLIEDTNSVIIVGNDCRYYNENGMFCPVRYPYQSPIARISRQVHEDVESALNEGLPKYVVVPNECSLFSDLIKKRYSYIESTPNFVLYGRPCEH